MGYHVMVYADGKYSPVKFFVARSQAEAHVEKLLLSGEWSGKPPYWITGDEWDSQRPKLTPEQEREIDEGIKRVRKVWGLDA